MTWQSGDKVAKGSRIPRIVQPNVSGKLERCELVDSAGNVVWFADVVPGAHVEWSTYPAWEVPDDLTVRIGPPPTPTPRSTVVLPPLTPSTAPVSQR